MCELNKLDCSSTLPTPKSLSGLGNVNSHLQPAQARAQPMDPQFLLTPIFGQYLFFHNTPDATIWSSKFQKNPREGLTAPPPLTPPRFFSGFALDLGSALKSQALRAPDSGFEAWLRPCALEPICHIKLRLSQYLLLLTITPEVGL